MRRFSIILSLLFITSAFCRANFSAKGGLNGNPYVIQPPSGTGLDKVFIFNGIQNASLTFEVTNPLEWTWYIYDKDQASAQKVDAADVEYTDVSVTIKNVQSDHGYFVLSGSGLKKYVYVVGYEPIIFSSIVFLDEGNICDVVTMKISATSKPLEYYSVSGIKRSLERQYKLIWNTLEWNTTSSAYDIKEMSSTSENVDNNWSVTSPLTDTYFSVSGDQYATFFGIERTFKSNLFKAVAVKTTASAVLQERNAENETGKNTGDLSGSAPLNIQFFSNPSDAVNLVEWYIYKPNDESGAYTRFTDQDLNYSFKDFGTYKVKLFVSNTVCRDSAEFNPKVSDFFLECPNFFTPRSSPGENDEFRVAYRSVVSFKGVIVNRWGNVMFEWNDPALGWDGNYKGKPVSPGVYFYVIEAKGSDGIIYNKKGDINLLE